MGNYRSILEAVDYSAMAVMAWLVGWVQRPRGYSMSHLAMYRLSVLRHEFKC